MKKISAIFLSSVILCCSSGCALITPPPFINSTTEITRDASGKLTSSRYYRGVTGFSYNGDKETARDWADSEQIARTGSLEQLSSNSTELEGIVASNGRDVSIAIVGNGLKRNFYVKSGQEVTGTLPPGKYTATTYYRSKPYGTWDFEVRPQNKHNYSGKEVYWYTVYNR